MVTPYSAATSSRFCVPMKLVLNPVLLMDEPFGAVDAKVRCTYHPSYILHIPMEEKDRKKEAKDAIWADMLEVIAALRSA